jgi:hypothetical protein
LLKGLLEMDQKLMELDFDAVLAVACIAFGFVFIHPFVDGNGRIHRYLINHILTHKGFAPKRLIFRFQRPYWLTWMSNGRFWNISLCPTWILLTGNRHRIIT